MHLSLRSRLLAPPRRRAVVLLLVLLVVVALSLSAYRYSDAMSAEYRLADSAVRVMQAQALADSGISYAAALLSNPSSFSGVLNSTPWNNLQAFQGVIVQPNNHPHFQGRFNLLAPPVPDESVGNPPYRYGVNDEAAKINLNTIMALDPSGKTLYNLLMALPNMTPDVADAIVDWIDSDNKPRANGAEEDYYQTLTPPYHCKNGPLDSLEELLLVRGVTPELLFGNDRNRNGILDPSEDDGRGICDQGWSAYLTIYSREQDFDVQYNPRIYVNSSDVKTVYEKLTDAVGQDLAYYIAAYRLYGPISNPAAQLRTKLAAQLAVGNATAGSSASGDSTPSKSATPTKTAPAKPVVKTDQAASGGTTPKKSGSTATTDTTQPKVAAKGERDDLDFSQKPVKTIQSLYELIGTAVNVPNKQSGTTHYECPLNDPDTLRERLPLLVDKATTRSNSEIPARININTTPLAVLTALPGLTQDDLQSIVDHRPNPLAAQPPDAIFQTPTWLITEANLAPAKLIQLEKYITTRSQSYRVQSIGYFDRDGPRARMEAVIDTNNGRPRIVYRRDLTELMPAFNLER